MSIKLLYGLFYHQLISCRAAYPAGSENDHLALRDICVEFGVFWLISQAKNWSRLHTCDGITRTVSTFDKIHRNKAVGQLEARQEILESSLILDPVDLSISSLSRSKIC